MKKYFILIAVVCGFLASCGPKPELPTVTTNSIEVISDTSACCVGEIVDNGNADITAKGFCWSTEQNPTLEDNSIAGAELLSRNEPANNYFSAELSGLTAATEYYVRAYATNSEGTAYGENLKFTTLENNEEPETPEIPEDPETQYEYVDLGLPSGVKWATCNVGATNSVECGNYYAWGEIATKEDYSSATCTSYGKDLGVISGNPEYDAATAEWGSAWRTPKLEDMYELVTQCEWIWSEQNEIAGFNVVSKTNGNHIFLPAAGWMNTEAAAAAGVEGVMDQGKWGYYWTATPYGDEENKRACFVTFSSGGYMTDFGLRRPGFTIRPVMD